MALIVVIDDDEAIRTLIAAALRFEGYEVAEANNGAAGRALVRGNAPDLVVSDVNMPVMDGFEATRQIRKLPGFEQIPILAASASVFDCHQQQSQYYHYSFLKHYYQ